MVENSSQRDHLKMIKLKTIPNKKGTVKILVPANMHMYTLIENYSQGKSAKPWMTI